jgi:hypothetical protein
MNPPPTDLLEITNSMVEALATNAAVVAAFPHCFNGFTRTRQDDDCGGCTRRKRHTGDDYARVRSCLAGLPADRIVRLKQLLNTQKLRIVVRSGTDARKLTSMIL